MKPIVGWIAGVHLDDLGSAAPVVVNGETLSFRQDQALATHIPLPESLYLRIEILNLFQPGPGDEICFSSTGFSAQACFVNRCLVNLAQHMVEQGVDTRLPLVANYPAPVTARPSPRPMTFGEIAHQLLNQTMV